MKLNLLVLMIIAMSCNQLLAQVEYEKRIEIELKNEYVRESVFEFGERGLLIRSKRKEKIDGQIEWMFQKMDTDLNEINTSEFKIDKQYFLDESITTDDRHFVLFQDKKDRYVLGNIGIDDMIFEKVSGTLPNKSTISDMVVMGDYSYSKAYIRREPVLFIINWKTGEQKIIPVIIEGYNRRQIRVQNLQVLEEANEVHLYVVAINARKKSDLYVLSMDSEGNKKEKFNLTETIEKNIVDISSNKLGDNKYVFTGTYSGISVSGSQGLFFGQTTDNEIDYMEFYNFLDLKDFLSYLPERREERLEKKRRRKESRGKELKINYQIADHNILELEDGYLFIGEAYYPTYRSEPYTSYSTVNGVSTPRTTYRNVFDGYQYTHAVIAKFDENGQLIWDRNFDLYQTYKPYYARKFIEVSESNTEGVKLVYSSRERIVSKHIDFDGQIYEDEESEEIETGFDGDKTKWASSNLFYWYDDYFVAFGRQKIKNRENDSVDRKRRVLFINKIKY